MNMNMNMNGVAAPPSMASFTSASSAVLRSTASIPSFRARESVAVPMPSAAARPSPQASGPPGGNVKVVVRVRAFLRRGMYIQNPC